MLLSTSERIFALLSARCTSADLLRNGLPVLLGADREFARQGFGSGVDQGLDQQGVAVAAGRR